MDTNDYRSKKPLRMRDNIADAPENEIAQLCAIAHGATICEARRLEVADTIVKEAREYNQHNRFGNRPVDVKAAWHNVTLKFVKHSHKPVNAELSESIKAFFLSAVRTGYKTNDQLSCYLEESSDVLSDFASLAASIDGHDAVVINRGRQKRQARQAVHI